MSTYAETLYQTVNHPLGNWVREQIPNTTAAAAVNNTIGILALVGFVSVAAAVLIYLERKICAHMQARLGPMRVGWHGILQSFADIFKLLLKEEIRPKGVDFFTYYLAPLLPMTASFLVLAVIPFDANIQLTDVKLGVLYVIAVSGLGIFGLLIGGWSGNNKYSLLGAMRTGAQMISYEISIALGLLLIVMLSGTASLREIVFSQQGTVMDWWIIKAPGVGLLGFVLFLISGTAELNRGPFDLAEAESELTAGFHTEYSGITFGMFFLAEFTNMVIMAGLISTFFLGGFLAPQFGNVSVDPMLAAIPGYIWFTLKGSFIIFLFMMFRWTFPRLRVDQLMALEWKFLLPASLANLAVGAVLAGQGWLL